MIMSVGPTIYDVVHEVEAGRAIKVWLQYYVLWSLLQATSASVQASIISVPIVPIILASHENYVHTDNALPATT